MESFERMYDLDLCKQKIRLSRNLSACCDERGEGSGFWLIELLRGVNQVNSVRVASLSKNRFILRVIIINFLSAFLA